MSGRRVVRVSVGRRDLLRCKLGGRLNVHEKPPPLLAPDVAELMLQGGVRGRVVVRLGEK